MASSTHEIRLRYRKRSKALSRKHGFRTGTKSCDDQAALCVFAFVFPASLGVRPDERSIRELASEASETKASSQGARSIRICRFHEFPKRTGRWTRTRSAYDDSLSAARRYGASSWRIMRAYTERRFA